MTDIEAKLTNGKMRISKPEIDFTRTNNFKTLDDLTAHTHIETLGSMLRLMSKFIYERMGTAEGGQNAQLQNYLLQLGDSLDMILLRNELESLRPNADVKSDCAIDPSSSGYPIAIRDFYELEKDKLEAEKMLSKMPDDKNLVDHALSSLFREVYPSDIVLTKMEKDYFTKLSGLEIPSSLKFSPELYVKKDKGSRFLYKKTVERLDLENNMPRFYTIYFAVTEEMHPEKAIWKKGLEKAISEGLSTVSTMELPYLARKIEDIDGIQLVMVERFDIGPFYSKLTENDKGMQELLEGTSDKEGVLAFKKSSVHRVSETPRKGFVSSVKGWFTGDNYIGIFSDILQSPTYMILPHRLIQKVHNLRLDLGAEVRLYGINNIGGING